MLQRTTTVETNCRTSRPHTFSTTDQLGIPRRALLDSDLGIQSEYAKMKLAVLKMIPGRERRFCNGVQRLHLALHAPLACNQHGHPAQLTIHNERGMLTESEVGQR